MSTARFNTLQNAAGSKSVPVDTVVDGTAKAWVNFNGTGTVAVRAAFNVSSIADNGVGDYTINFTNAMVDGNYSATGLVQGGANGWLTGFTPSILSGSFRFTCVNGSPATTIDATHVYVAIFR